MESKVNVYIIKEKQGFNTFTLPGEFDRAAAEARALQLRRTGKDVRISIKVIRCPADK